MRARRFGSIAIVLGTLAAASPARAQTTPIQRGFAVDRLDLAERGSEWFALDSLDLRGKVRPAIGVTTVWSHRPLVAYDEDGNYLRSLVRHQVFIDPSASLVLFDRVRVGALVPIGVYAKGRTVVTNTATFPPPGGRLGDIRLGADVRLAGEYGDRFTLAAGSALYLPTGTRESYTSDGNTRVVVPRVTVAGDISLFVYSARAALHYRALTERYDGTRLGSQLELGGAAGVRLAKRRLVVGPEVFASSVLRSDTFLTSQATSVEAILGAHYSAGDFRFGAGVGRGLAHGLGSPAFRGVLSAEWAPAYEKPAPPPPPPPPPRVEPPPPPPPVEPPPPPPPDRDGDGIVDAEDACPDLPGVASPETYANGCPPDRDGDGVYDKDDACPDAPGPADPDPKKSGCPLARIEDGQIRIAEQVRFKSGSAEILGDSDMIIIAIASTMKMHPEIKKVRVEGHTDSTGSPQGNVKLSQARAEAVVAALVKRGVDKKRLVAKGVGAGNPIDSNQTEEGKQANRRVELHIVESAAP
ncbi:MAG: OmpA family protein [Labilithrix sp.]|nr:OmpA family protein [Labilithrix sp.]MCW5809807.1 OmpA family protein [Labilithrix sp.]